MKTKTLKYKYNNILLIDDNPLDNFINEKMIECTNFSKHINISTDGQTALDYVNKLINSNSEEAENNLDCMFVDLNMPLMDGFEFISHFKKINDKKLLKCKIIILTSSIAQEDRARSEKMDPEIIFINKPLTTQFLDSM